MQLASRCIAACLAAAFAAIYERLLRQGVYVAMRRGRLRISPHIHLTSEDIARALDALNDPSM